MKHLEIHIGKSSSETTIKADGQDITQCVRGVTVECEVGKATLVTFKVAPFVTTPFDISGSFMEVPRCDKCQHWERPDGECHMIEGQNFSADFGCVLFKPTLTGEPTP